MRIASKKPSGQAVGFTASRITAWPSRRIETVSLTMGYYVDLTAGDLSAQLWAGFGPSEGNTAGLGNKPGNIGRLGTEAESRNPLPGKPLQTGAGEPVTRSGID